MKVKFETVNKIVNVCTACDKFVDNVYAVSGRYRVNAKSLMGLYSLDLSHEISLIIDSENVDVINNFIKTIKGVLNSSD